MKRSALDPSGPSRKPRSKWCLNKYQKAILIFALVLIFPVVLLAAGAMEPKVCLSLAALDVIVFVGWLIEDLL